MANTQHLDNSFKHLLQQFYDTTVDDCNQQRIAESMGLQHESSPKIDEVANQLYRLFQTRLSIQGAINVQTT